MNEKKIFAINNFDLIRLLAATQVVYHHVIREMDVELTGLTAEFHHILSIFPGVPIFFFVSGFLISRSYENNSKTSEYFLNRFLRLFPGLTVCVAISIALVAISGYLTTVDVSIMELVFLFLSKITILQSYNPDFLRAYGDGVLNGALWTITVEIEFYILLPIMYVLFNLESKNKSTLKLIFILIFFFLLNRAFTYIPAEYGDGIPYKLVKYSFIPYFYMFILGVIFQKNFDFFHRILSGKLLYLLPVYCLIAIPSLEIEGMSFGNNVNPFIFILMITVIFTFAYSYENLSNTLLRRNDISYGVYIYHTPIINYMLYNLWANTFSHAMIALASTIIIAIISWKLIEYPSLLLKKHPLSPFK